MTGQWAPRTYLPASHFFPDVRPLSFTSPFPYLQTLSSLHLDQLPHTVTQKSIATTYPARLKV